MDKLSAMTTFAAVATTGSFTRAGELLGLPKARVSQRVADLERHLGVRLLHRTTRALSLTEDGHAYLGKCQAILQDIDELESLLKGGAIAPRGKLRVEALVSVARWVIAPRLQDFQARYPDISVRLGGSDQIRHLLEEGIDCAIRGGHLEDSSQIARHVCDVRLGLYAAPHYLQAIGGVQHPDALAAHRRISWFAARRQPFAWRLQADAETCEVPAAEGLLFDDPDAAIAACMAGSGICPGAPFAVATWVHTGALVPVLPQWSFPSRPIHIVYPSNRHLSARVRCFVDWALALMRADPNLQMTPRELAERLPLPLP